MNTFDYNRLDHKTIKIKSSYELTLESWLSKFVADEFYFNYNWDECGEVANCIMKKTISMLPKYLILQLIRLESVYTSTGIILTKNNEFVDFPTKDLDLSSIYSGDSSIANCIYDLCGVVHHCEKIKGYSYSKRKSNINKVHLIIFINSFVNIRFVYENMNIQCIIF